MPILGGLFARKPKPASSPVVNANASLLGSTTSVVESSSSCISVSPTTELVNANKSLPSSPNGKKAPSIVYPAAASSSRLRLHFGRKKLASSSASIASSSNDHEVSTPRPSYDSRAATDVSERRKHLRPPPSRSAVFAAYGDPSGSHSTRSLPNERVGMSHPPSPPLPPVPSKRSFFHWSKSQKSDNKLPPSKLTKSHTPSISTSNLGPDNDASSFNLKSFRHVTPGSPTYSNASNASISPLPAPIPRPRPRGTSIASDSSQRISVAAFREAQARRSQAGSPSPSIRSPSPGVLPMTSNKSFDNRSSPNVALLNSYSSSQVPQQRRPAPRRTSVFTDSDTSASSSEEEDSDDGGPKRGDAPLGRRRTVTQKTSNRAVNPLDFRTRARSELGHGSSWSKEPSPKPGHQPPARPPRSSPPAGTRIRPSKSASAPLQTPKASPPIPSNADTRSIFSNSRHLRESSTYSSSDSDSDSDNAPLAKLVPPRRPGSAMSSASGSRSNVNLPGSRPGTPSKQRAPPLIDIKTLSQPSKPGAPFTVPRLKSNDIAFTQGTTLIATGRTATSPPPGPLSKSIEPPLPNKFVLPPLETEDGPSRFVSSPTSTETSSTLPSPRLDKKSSSGALDVISKNDMQFPSRPESRDWLSSPPRSPPEGKDPSSTFAKSEAAPVEKPREMISDRLTRVVKQSDPFPSDKTSRQSRRASSGDLTLSLRLSSGDDYFNMGNLGDGLMECEVEQTTDELRQDRIAPVVIKQRVPPSSFAVTSRPQHRSNTSTDTMRAGTTVRQRSSTLLPSSSPAPFSTNSTSGGSPSTGIASPASAKRPGQPRARSSTMMTKMTGSPVMNVNGNMNVFPVPTKPFAERRESPSSSTGDSSSGRAPFTPMDGSDAGGTSGSTRTAGRKGGEPTRNSGVSGLRMGPVSKATGKRRSVTFESPEPRDGDKGLERLRKSLEEEETRRKERRRTEAKAAIELGNVINGRGPILDEDDEDADEEDRPINQAYGGRMGMMKPMMGLTPSPLSMPMGSPGWNSMGNGWQPEPGNMLPNQYMMMSPSPTADPNFLAAHQQAMFIAKQAYQMAVAQQAMAAAADEWERGSAAGSVYGGPPSLGYGMTGIPGGWPGGGMMFPPTARSMYGGVAQSEYGGGSMAGGGWGTRSVYGDAFGPSSNNRQSKNMGQQSKMYGHNASQSIPGRDGLGSPTRPRTNSQPSGSPRPGVRRAPPPSSWRAGV